MDSESGVCISFEELQRFELWNLLVNKVAAFIFILAPSKSCPILVTFLPISNLIP
jgi:hypothetical protein